MTPSFPNQRNFCKYFLSKGLFSIGVLFTMLLAFVNLTTAQDLDLPSEPTGHVNDFAGMLSNNEQQRLETKLRNYREYDHYCLCHCHSQKLKRYFY